MTIGRSCRKTVILSFIVLLASGNQIKSLKHTRNEQDNQDDILVLLFFFRFDQKLKDAVNLNTTGTLRVLELAETMENLEVRFYMIWSTIRICLRN